MDIALPDIGCSGDALANNKHRMVLWFVIILCQKFAMDEKYIIKSFAISCFKTKAINIVQQQYIPTIPNLMLTTKSRQHSENYDDS